MFYSFQEMLTTILFGVKEEVPWPRLQQKAHVQSSGRASGRTWDRTSQETQKKTELERTE